MGFNELNWLLDKFEVAGKSRLAKQTPLEHNAIMTESSVFAIDVVKDIGNPNRFRWNIYENMKVRDKSFYSFATRREAQNDADKFVRKLNSIWPASLSERSQRAIVSPALSEIADRQISKPSVRVRAASWLPWESQSMGTSTAIEMAAEIIAAFVANNSLPKTELPALNSSDAHDRNKARRRAAERAGPH